MILAVERLNSSDHARILPNGVFDQGKCLTKWNHGDVASARVQSANLLRGCGILSGERGVVGVIGVGNWAGSNAVCVEVLEKFGSIDLMGVSKLVDG